jgi:hypothetical protein
MKKMGKSAQMYNKLWLMVPTYKRLDWIQRFIESAIDKADKPEENIGFVFCVNHKDKISLDYLTDFCNNKFRDAFIIQEKSIQPNLSLYYNMMYDALVKEQGECVVSMLGDDMVFETKGYDTRLLEEINKHEGVGVFWCDDGYIAHDKCCINLFVTKKMIELTGKPFMCPFYKADMIDMVWWWVGHFSQTGVYLGDVIIKHLHNSSLPGYDPTFMRLRPLQISANAPDQQQLGRVYATIIAGDLIASGFGSWNSL